MEKTKWGVTVLYKCLNFIALSMFIWLTLKLVCFNSPLRPYVKVISINDSGICLCRSLLEILFTAVVTLTVHGLVSKLQIPVSQPLLVSSLVHALSWSAKHRIQRFFQEHWAQGGMHHAHTYNHIFSHTYRQCRTSKACLWKVYYPGCFLCFRLVILLR